MAATVKFLAVDLGASNGRLLLGQWDGAGFKLQEIHRFPNGPVTILGNMYTDALGLWTEIKNGLMRYAAQHAESPSGIAIDTWGCDYALLDERGRLLGNPAHYRDPRTNGVLEQAFAVVPRAEIARVTGLQIMQLNTLFQLYSMRWHGDAQLDQAKALLMIPDLFHFWMTGERIAEYTIASTTQMLRAADGQWAVELLKKLDIPTSILPQIVQPGTIVGPLLRTILQEVGIHGELPVIAGASHDTASAVAGVPGLDAHSMYISSGTWSLIGVETRKPIITQAALDHNFTNEGGVGGTIRMLKNATGLWLLQESRRYWEREGMEITWPAMLQQAESAAPFRSLVNPDAHDFLAPSAMPETIRNYCRKTGQPEPGTVGEVVRCCLESLALRYRGVVEALEEVLTSADGVPGPRIKTIRIMGGGSQNRMLNQFVADSTQRTVVSGPAEAAALGLMMVQAIATGHLSSLEEGRAAIAASVAQEVFEPRDQQAWDDAYGRFLQLAG